MDYFGVIDIQLPLNKQTKCECKNKQDKLPYCNENMECMKKNLDYLLLQNSKMTDEIYKLRYKELL